MSKVINLNGLINRAKEFARDNECTIGVAFGDEVGQQLYAMHLMVKELMTTKQQRIDYILSVADAVDNFRLALINDPDGYPDE